jgi:hypothetical protein
MTRTVLEFLFIGLNVAWTDLRQTFTGTYRPELHYMRGPGPKAREKHPV